MSTAFPITALPDVPFYDLPCMEQARRMDELLNVRQWNMLQITEYTGLATIAIEKKLLLPTYPEHIRRRLEDDTLSEEKAHQLAREWYVEQAMNSHSDTISKAVPKAPDTPDKPKLRVPTPAEFRALSALEKARILQRMKDELDMTWKEIAEQLGFYQQNIYPLLELLKLPEDIMGQLERGEIAQNKARQLARKRQSDHALAKQAVPTKKPKSEPAKAAPPTPKLDDGRRTTDDGPKPEPVSAPEPSQPLVPVEPPVSGPLATVIPHWLEAFDAPPEKQSTASVFSLFLTMLALADAQSLDEAMSHAGEVVIRIATATHTKTITLEQADTMTELLAAALHLAPQELIELSRLQHRARQATRSDARAAFQRSLEVYRKQAVG